MSPSLENYLANFSEEHIATVVGPFAKISRPLTEPVIFVDGGTRFRQATEGIAVGDGDSFAGHLDIVLDPDKDFSDLSFALSAFPDNIAELDLLGFLGGRRDHELFNLGEAHRFLESRNLPCRVQFDDSIIGYSAGSWELFHNGCFSIAVIEETMVTIRGDCRFPCDHPRRFTPLSSLGLSNEAKGTILIESAGTVFVFLQGDQP